MAHDKLNPSHYQGFSNGAIPWDIKEGESALDGPTVIRVSTAAATATVEKYGVGQPAIDAAHIVRQREFSLRTFGPGCRTNGVTDHIAKELDEIREAPLDLSEWADVIILALDGAWRTGAEPQDIIDAVLAKQAKNEARDWPDWRTQDPDKAIEHNRGGDR